MAKIIMPDDDFESMAALIRYSVSPRVSRQIDGTGKPGFCRDEECQEPIAVLVNGHDL
jgi:hypothetical protein